MFAAIFTDDRHSSFFCDFSDRRESHSSEVPRQLLGLAWWNGEKQFVVVATMEGQSQGSSPAMEFVIQGLNHGNPCCFH